MKLVFDIETVGFDLNSLSESQQEFILRYSEKETDKVKILSGHAWVEVLVAATLSPLQLMKGLLVSYSVELTILKTLMLLIIMVNQKL